MNESALDRIVKDDRLSPLPGMPDVKSTLHAVREKASFACAPVRRKDSRIRDPGTGERPGRAGVFGPARERFLSGLVLLVTLMSTVFIVARGSGSLWLALAIPSVQLVAFKALIKEEPSL